ncbi:MAG: hypothetical protein HXM47_02175 [Pseudoleptotrichia goodfellowii]|nr:hypothetical protein [Pseudoleptotrichia goodfellowii]
MRKIIIFVMLLLSVQLFSEDYKVVLKKNVTLSEQDLKKNNKEIEIAAKKGYNLITEASLDGVQNLFSQIFQSLVPESVHDKDFLLIYQQKLQKFYSDFLSNYIKKNKIKVEKIRYVTNDVVEVTLEIQMLDITKVMGKTFINTEKDKSFDDIILENAGKISQEELVNKILTKEFDEMNKSLNTIKDYSIIKTSIYLEKDNNKWGIAELDEKIQNMKDIYKSAGKK